MLALCWRNWLIVRTDTTRNWLDLTRYDFMHCPPARMRGGKRIRGPLVSVGMIIMSQINSSRVRCEKHYWDRGSVQFRYSGFKNEKIHWCIPSQPKDVVDASTSFSLLPGSTIAMKNETRMEDINLSFWWILVVSWYRQSGRFSNLSSISTPLHRRLLWLSLFDMVVMWWKWLVKFQPQPRSASDFR